MEQVFEVARWTTGGVFMAFGILCAIGNWGILISLVLTKREGGVSFIPVIGGICITVGALVLPLSGLWRWAWIGLLVDFGCVPLFAWAALAEVYQKHKR